ncbi:hypothetical protein CCP4SC76_5780018 [Gammaproteobacteria bacterium]
MLGNRWLVGQSGYNSGPRPEGPANPMSDPATAIPLTHSDWATNPEHPEPVPEEAA